MDAELRGRIGKAVLNSLVETMGMDAVDRMPLVADALAPIIAEVEAAARADEREKAAKVAEDDRHLWGAAGGVGGAVLLAKPEVIAAAIRAQKEPSA